MAEKENCKLFSEFAPNTMQEWIDKVTVDLKGADFNKKLVWRTNEGFNVQPMYRLENMQDLKNLDCLPGEFPFVRGNKKITTIGMYVRISLWKIWLKQIKSIGCIESRCQLTGFCTEWMPGIYQSRYGSPPERHLLGMCGNQLCRRM